MLMVKPLWQLRRRTACRASGTACYLSCRIFYALCYLYLAGSAVAQPTATEPLSKSEQGQIYDQGIHILGGNANVISKWVDDIRFAIIGQATENSTILARATLADIADQTGLSLKPVEHGFRDPLDYLKAVEASPPFQLATCPADGSSPEQCANFVVLFANRETMQALSKAIPLRPVYQRAFSAEQDIPCFFAPFQTKAMVINQAFVYVNQELPQAMVRTCLQEEIYQSFGLFNDYSGSTFYSFNNKVEPKSITVYDRALLASVYDAEISPGAPVWRVMERLMENLEIDPFTQELVK